MIEQNKELCDLLASLFTEEECRKVFGTMGSWIYIKIYKVRCEGDFIKFLQEEKYREGLIKWAYQWYLTYKDNIPIRVSGSQKKKIRRAKRIVELWKEEYNC